MSEHYRELRVRPDTGQSAEELADRLDSAAANGRGVSLNVVEDIQPLGWQELTQIRRTDPAAQGYQRCWTCICLGIPMTVYFEGDSLRLRPTSTRDKPGVPIAASPAHSRVQPADRRSLAPVRLWSGILVAAFLAMGISVTAPGEYSLFTALFLLIAGAVTRLGHALGVYMLDDRPTQRTVGNWLIIASWVAIALALL